MADGRRREAEKVCRETVAKDLFDTATGLNDLFRWGPLLLVASAAPGLSPIIAAELRFGGFLTMGTGAWRAYTNGLQLAEHAERRRGSLSDSIDGFYGAD